MDNGIGNGNKDTLRKPGPPHRSLSCPADDNSDTNNEGIIELNVPYEAEYCLICKNSGRGNLHLLTLEMAIAHANQRHDQVQILFKCRRCDKEYITKRGILCHIPKCPGPRNARPGEVECPICKRFYKSSMGLSQHERTAHPEARNAARARSSSDGGPSVQLRTGKLFPEDEVRLMLRLEPQFLGRTNINKLMLPHLPGKTCKQIRDKRNTTVYKKLREEYLVDHMPEAQATIVPNSPPRVELPQERQPLPVAPAVEISDYSKLQPEEAMWRSTILQSLIGAIDGVSPAGPTTTKERSVLTLRQALQYALETNGDIPQDHIDYIYDAAMAGLNPHGQVKRKHTSSKMTKTKRARKRFIYARTQELFKKNPGQLAKCIRTGVDHIVENKSPHDPTVLDTYRALWETVPAVQLPDFVGRSPALELSEVLSTISKAEVKERISRLKAKSAAGPDGVTRRDIHNSSSYVILHLLFNLFMATSKTPSKWMENRTTLILKEGKSGDDVGDYRPITINSIIARCFWGIIDHKIRGHIRLSPRQKGFVSEAGCFNNIQTLNEIILHSKQQKLCLAVVQLDISKAFDTVPHEAIGPALSRAGLPQPIINLILGSYRAPFTRIGKGSTALPINIKRGVKQGDPLSPLIFNLIMDPLLETLENAGGYAINSEQTVASLAFADDIILLAKDGHQAGAQLRRVEEYLNNLGMKLSAPKCKAFEIRHTRDSWYVADPDLKLSSLDGIPYAQAGSEITYLGMKISPWSGVTISGIKDNLSVTLNKIQRLSLKPPQKLDLVTSHIIPHYLYCLTTAIPPITFLRELDQVLRVFTREIFHLPQCTANGLLYSRRRDGGLGLPRLEALVTATALQAGLKFTTSADPVMASLAEGSRLLKRLEGLARAARIATPITAGDILAYKLRSLKEIRDNWGRLGSQGKSVAAHSNDRFGNAWLLDPSLLKPCRMITALRMRTNTCGDRIAMNRLAPDMQGNVDVRCRKCKTQLETLGHILGQCIHTKADRINRHNEILNLIINKISPLKSTAAVAQEPSLRTPEGTRLKPDLVVKNQEGVLVVDVTVRHEDGDGIRQGFDSKIAKYTALLGPLRDLYSTESGAVLPIVIGTRGAMPRETITNLRKLGIVDPGTLKTISLIALRSSIETYHKFMDYNAPLGPNVKNRIRNRQPP